LRRAAFAGGALLLLLVFVSPVQTLSTTYLLSAHLVQNVVLAEWAPALVVLGIPPSAAASLARFRIVRAVTHPLVALPLWLVTYAAWHVPAAYDAALRRPDSLLLVEHASYFLAGLALWWPVFQAAPRALRPAAKAGYLFAAFLVASPIGLVLALFPDPLYGFYEAAPRIWGVSAIRDQQLAGILMSGAEAVVFFALFAYYFLRFLQEEDRAQAPPVTP
jgi:putative membrane protein